MDKRGIVHDNDNLDTTLASKDDWLNKINDYGQQFRIEKKKAAAPIWPLLRISSLR